MIHEAGLNEGPLADEPSEAATVSLDLFPTGDDVSSYCTSNDPSQPYQRRTITNREGIMVAKCKLSEVVHGRLGLLEGFEEGEDHPATLMVLDFAFDSLKETRRIEAAEVTFHFTKGSSSDDDDDEGNDPAVVRIQPDGSLTLVETSQPVDTKMSGGFKIGAPPLAGFGTNAELAWERSKTKLNYDSTRLVGNTRQIGRDFGDDNAACWNFLQNRTENTGVPTAVRTSILLKREHDRPFRCIFQMKLKLDFKSSLKSAFKTVMGERIIDDPVLFDPTKKPTKRQLELFDTNSLASTDLRLLSSVVTKTILDDTVRHVGQG